MKGQADTPVDRTELQIRLLMERIGVWVLKAHVAPIREASRRKMAEQILEEFDIRAKWVGDRPVFEAPEMPPGTLQLLQTPTAPIATLTEAQLDHLIENRPINVKQFIPPDLPQNSDICSVCNGKTKVCFTCNQPEGSCNHVRFGGGIQFRPVICPACDGTGKDPNA